MSCTVAGILIQQNPNLLDWDSTPWDIFPDLRVYARARDDRHATELARAGANIVVPELVATGVKLAGSIVERGDPLAPESEEGEPGPSA